MLGRAEAQVVRLATLHALINRERMIRLADLEAALALWDYCDESVKYIFGTLTGDQLADRVHKIITDKGQASKTNIYSALGCNVKSAEIQEAIGMLLELELVSVTKERMNGADRPTTFYSPNQATE